MSTKDAELGYAILLIASFLVIVLVVIYGPQPSRFSEDLIRKGPPPMAARAASPMARQGVMAAQSARSGEQTSEAALTRTVTVDRQADTPTAQSDSGLGFKRSAATKTVQGAKAATPGGDRAASSVDGTRSAETRTVEAVKPDGVMRSKLTRSAPGPAARAAPSAGAETDASLNRTAGAQMANAKRSGDGRQPAKDLSRSVMTAADRAAAQPTASQAFGRILSRSGSGQATQAAKAGDERKELWLCPLGGRANPKSGTRRAGLPRRGAVLERGREPGRTAADGAATEMEPVPLVGSFAGPGPARPIKSASPVGSKKSGRRRSSRQRPFSCRVCRRNWTYSSGTLTMKLSNLNVAGASFGEVAVMPMAPPSLGWIPLKR